LYFDRCCAIEDVDHYGDQTMRLVDLVDVAFEVLEIAFLDPNMVANGERDRGLNLRFDLIPMPLFDAWRR